MKKENTDNIDKSEDKPKRTNKRKTKNSIKEQSKQLKKFSKNDIKPISLKDSYGSFLKDNDPFRIYLNGQVIYDSEKQQMNIEFLEDSFILGDDKYEYKGIKVEKYNK